MTYNIYHENSLGLSKIEDNQVHSVVTAPPYGISYQNLEWDKVLPLQKTIF